MPLCESLVECFLMQRRAERVLRVLVLEVHGRKDLQQLLVEHSQADKAEKYGGWCSPLRELAGH